jgi:hypothetical protein
LNGAKRGDFGVREVSRPNASRSHDGKRDQPVVDSSKPQRITHADVADRQLRGLVGVPPDNSRRSPLVPISEWFRRGSRSRTTNVFFQPNDEDDPCFKEANRLEPESFRDFARDCRHGYSSLVFLFPFCRRLRTIFAILTALQTSMPTYAAVLRLPYNVRKAEDQIRGGLPRPRFSHFE